MEKDNLVIMLSTQKGYIRRYLHHLNDNTTQAQAYEKVESEYREIFKQNRYSSFESFRQIKNRSLKQN